MLKRLTATLVVVGALAAGFATGATPAAAANDGDQARNDELATKLFELQRRKQWSDDALGKKLGNMQIFTDDGNVTRVTVVEAGPVTVVGKRTEDKDGYSALILGFGERKAKHVRKAQKVSSEKLGQKPAAQVREIVIGDGMQAEHGGRA